MRSNRPREAPSDGLRTPAGRHDVVVIGAGLSGLSAAAVLARRGARVAVFEARHEAGGLTVPEGWDLLAGVSAHSPLLAEMGIAGSSGVERAGPAYSVRFPRHRFDALSDVEAFRLELSTLFPADASGIARFLQELHSGEEVPDDPATVPAQADRTVSEVLDPLVHSPEARAALTAPWILAGLPPSRLAWSEFAALIRALHSAEQIRIPGGRSALVRALTQVVQSAGGTIECGARVVRVHRQRGTVTGVTLEDGRCFQAGAVVSTIGPATLFEELMAERGLADAGYPPLRAGWITSMSALEVDLWLVDPTVVPEGRFLCQTGYDPANAYLDLQRSAPEFGAFVCTTLRAGMDASVELSDLPHVSLFAPAPYSRADHWEVPIPARGDVEALSRPAYVELVSDLADRLIASADAFFPELAEGVVESVTRTPLTIEARTGRTGGAFSGWARIPQQGGVLYPGARTTFRNLYLAGVWTARCIPLLGQLESGVAAASMIVDAADG